MVSITVPSLCCFSHTHKKKKKKIYAFFPPLFYNLLQPMDTAIDIK